MDGFDVSKRKNIPTGLGVASAGFGYRAWIVFRNLRIRQDTKEVFLSELQRKPHTSPAPFRRLPLFHSRSAEAASPRICVMHPYARNQKSGSFVEP